MKNLYVLIAALISPWSLYAQTQNDNVVNEQIGVLHQKKLEKAPEEGNYFLTDHPEKMKLVQADSLVLEDVWCRYNLRDDQFEIGGVGISGEKVMSFELGSDEYVRAPIVNKYFENQSRFCRVIFQGTYELYASTDVIFKPSNYNLLMDVGSRSDTYVKEEKYYLFENNQLIIETTSTKKIAKHLKSKNDSLSNYSKKNKLSNQESDVLEMLDFLENT